MRNKLLKNYLPPYSSHVSRLKQFSIPLLVFAFFCNFYLLIVLSVESFHCKLKSAFNSSTGKISRCSKAFKIVLESILFPYLKKHIVHTDHVNPCFLQRKLLLGLKEHCHEGFFTFTVLVPIAQILDSLHVLLRD